MDKRRSGWHWFGVVVSERRKRHPKRAVLEAAVLASFFSLTVVWLTLSCVESRRPAWWGLPVRKKRDSAPLGVLHANYDYAFQMSSTCKYMNALQQDFHCVSADKDPHPFGDRTDLHLDSCRFDYEGKHFSLTRRDCWNYLLQNFSIVHLHEFVPVGGFRGLAKLREKNSHCIIVTTHGTEYRPVDRHLELNSMLTKSEMASGASSEGVLRDKYIQEAMAVEDDHVVWRLRTLKLLANAVLASDSELFSYFPNYYDQVLPRIVEIPDDVTEPLFSPRNSLRKLKIVHAPSHGWRKGTEWVRRAIRNLQQETGLQDAIDYVEISGSSNEIVRSHVLSADIVIDQLRAGWYGVFATEAMTLGKPVIVYVRPDLQTPENVGSPSTAFALAHSQSIESVLRQLIEDEDYRRELSRRSFEFVRKQHSPKVVIPQLLDVYRHYCLENPKPFDAEQFRSFVEANADVLDTVPGI